MAKPKLDLPAGRQGKINIPPNILPELLTASEIRMLKNRWQIILALEEGLSIRSIAEEVGVGTDTVVRVARMSERKDLRKFLKKETISTKTPWIFGKSE